MCAGLETLITCWAPLSMSTTRTRSDSVGDAAAAGRHSPAADHQAAQFCVKKLDAIQIAGDGVEKPELRGAGL